MTMTATSSATFRQEVLDSERPVLVEFTAEWCGPCRQVAPILDRIADEEVARLKVTQVDVDANSDVALKYDVLGMPTFALFDKGAIVARFIGARPHAAIMREIEPHLS